MKKKIIGLFLFLVFCIPVLPVMQMGDYLAQGQLTEESCAVSEDLTKLNETEHLSGSILVLLKPGAPYTPTYLLLTEQLHSRQNDDIQTPPPLG